MLFKGSHSEAWERFAARARSPRGIWWLVGISLFEPIFLPIFPETTVVAMTFARREKWLRYVTIATLCALIGASVAYQIGHLLFHYLGLQIIAKYGLHKGFRAARELIGRNPLLIILFVAFTPIPDKLFIIPAGFFHVPFVPFIIGFCLRRGFWFTLSGYLAHRFGEKAITILSRSFKWIAAVVMLFVLYAILHFFHIFGL